MRTNYDFSQAPRAKDVPHLTALRTKSKAASKTRISILVDAEVIAAFRARAEAQDMLTQPRSTRMRHR